MPWPRYLAWTLLGLLGIGIPVPRLSASENPVVASATLHLGFQKTALAHPEDPAGPEDAAGVSACLEVIRQGVVEPDPSHGSDPTLDEECPRSVTVPGSVTVTGGAGEVLEVRVLALDPGDWWAPRTHLLLGPEPVEETLRLFPTGRLEAPVRVARGHTAPERLEARFQWAPDAEDGAEGEHTVLCPLEGSTLHCELPAGTLDLRWRARGFSTVFAWGMPVAAGTVNEAPSIHLVPGATVFGWVLPPVEEGMPARTPRATEASQGHAPQPTTRVTLRPRTTHSSTSPTDRQRQESVEIETTADERGFYAFPGVPSGSWELIAAHPGFAPSRLAPIIVRQGVELELPPLELHPPAALRVSVEPPTDPFGEPWRVEVQRRDLLIGEWPRVAAGKVDDGGLFLATPLELGPHEVNVMDGRGGRWHGEGVEVDAATVEHAVEIPWRRLEARVTLDDEPLPGARLSFSGRQGEERIRRRTDEEGKVYVFLPHREAPWVVEVEHQGRGILARVTDVEVRREDGEPWATVVIEVPTTRLTGKVINDEGRPLAEARVDVEGPEEGESDTVWTDADGHFELRGFQPGHWQVEASWRDRDHGASRSAPLRSVEVAEDVVAGPVTLVVTEDHRLTGQVVGPEGQAIPGALITALLEEPHGPVTRRVPLKTTAMDGSFEFDVPPAVAAVQLQVFPPGYAARQLRVRLPAEEAVIVPVDDAGGTIVLETSGPEDTDGGQAPPKVLLFGEYLYVTPALRMWAGSWGVRQEPGRLVVPSMAAGGYSACAGILEQVAALGRLPRALRDRCDHGTLSPGGTLHLRVPSPR